MENKKNSIIGTILAFVVLFGIGYVLLAPAKDDNNPYKTVKTEKKKNGKHELKFPEVDKALQSNGVLQATEYIENVKRGKAKLEIFISYKTIVLNTGRETDVLKILNNKFSREYKDIKLTLAHDTSTSYLYRDYELKDGKFIEVKY